MTRRTFNRTLPFTFVTLGLALGAVPGCGTTGPRGAEKEAKPADIASLKSVGAKANALVVWTSTREGISHLFTMKSDGSDLKQLTKGNQTDWNPRFSPDGSKILFSRSTEKGDVREAEVGDRAWDLFTIGADGAEPTKVVGNALWGSWISNDEVLFVRGSKIMRAKLGGEDDGEKQGKTEKKVMDLSKHAAFEGASVRAPELSRDGQEIAMTLTGGRRQVGIWSLKKKSWTQVGSGSLITWAPDGSAVTWISPTGKELAEIRSVPIENGAPAAKKDAQDAEETQDDEEKPDAEKKQGAEAAKLVDLQGKRSRESFPRLSADGKWLVFGAGIGSSDPDLEDYEIYLWEVGSSESPTRLTFHSSSDRWPDIFAGVAGKEAAPKTEEPEKAENADEAAPPAKASTDESAGEPEADKKAEPAAAGAEATTDEESETAPASAGKAKAKPKAKAGKKRR